MKKIFFVVALCLGLIIACSEDDDSGASTYSYGGPGSEWKISIGTATTGSFTITYASSPAASVSLTVEGTYERLSSGYTKLTVSTVTGSNGPSAGDIAYGLEIPGFAMLLKPMGEGDIIPLVVSGSCPSADFSANWIVTNYGGSDAYSTSADIFGTAAYTHSTTGFKIESKYSLASYTSLGADSDMNGSCTDGIMKVGSDLSNPDAYMWTTTSGAMLVQTQHDNGIIVAMPSTTVSAATALAGDYSGLLFNEGDTSAGSSGTTQPVKVTINSAGSSLVGYDYTDVDAGTTSSAVATMSIDAINSPENGMVKLTLNSKETICQVSENIVSSGKNMIFCAGVSPDDSTKLFNILLVSL